MSKRQRRKREKVRRHGPDDRPDRLGRQIATGAGVTVGATVLMGGVAHAACTCTVDSLADPTDTGHTTLRDAITSANVNSGSTITFASGLSGTITLGSALPKISAPTTITGPGAGQITVSGNDAFQVFYVDTNPGDDVSISGLTIAKGRAPGGNPGAGIYSLRADLTLSGAVVTDNHTSSGAGGGVGVYAGSLTIEGSTISGNTAGNEGGGVYTAPGSAATAIIRDSTISGNQGDDGGGAYFDYSAPAAVENSTIYGNTAKGVVGSGGGLYHLGAYDGNPGLTVTGSTITHNTAVRGGGVACYGAANGAGTHNLTEPILRDTIVFGNSAASADQGADVSCDFNNKPANGGTLPAAFSLLGSVDPGTTISQTGPNIFGQDPQLGPLASNGGPTQTQLPAASSPVIDKGSAFGLTTDQRGVQRPIDFKSVPNAAGGDGSDIGAFELQPDNGITLGKLKRNKKKGNANQIVNVPLPDAGSLTIAGKGIKTVTVPVADTGQVRLPVKPKGKTRKKENATGKAKVKAKVTYNPTGNAAKTLIRKLKLLKR